MNTQETGDRVPIRNRLINLCKGFFKLVKKACTYCHLVTLLLLFLYTGQLLYGIALFVHLLEVIKEIIAK